MSLVLKESRIETWRGGGEPLPFHTRLIEPDGRISRIRLSDKVSCGRQRDIASLLLQPDKTKDLGQGFVGIP